MPQKQEGNGREAMDIEQDNDELTLARRIGSTVPPRRLDGPLQTVPGRRWERPDTASSGGQHRDEVERLLRDMWRNEQARSAPQPAAEPEPVQVPQPMIEPAA